jgi:hypothetical protein
VLDRGDRELLVALLRCAHFAALAGPEVEAGEAGEAQPGAMHGLAAAVGTLVTALVPAHAPPPLSVSGLRHALAQEADGRGAREMLALELQRQRGVLDANAHPVYKLSAFASTQAYGEWRGHERARVAALLAAHWPLTDPLPPSRPRDHGGMCLLACCFSVWALMLGCGGYCTGIHDHLAFFRRITAAMSAATRDTLALPPAFDQLLNAYGCTP